jgi:membrane protease YdiL (CAAX protease family)
MDRADRADLILPHPPLLFYSLAGIATLSAYSYFQKYFEKTRSKDQTPVLPKLLSSPRPKDAPWKNIWESKYSRFTSFWGLMALLQAYFRTGILSIWWEDFFYSMANYFPMTIAMHRSLSVLFGHSSWIAMGAVILRWIPRPQSFFQKWYTNKKDTQWVWWTVGGYYVSSFLFNMADFVNQSVLPISILEQASESVVSQLINPEFNDMLASLVGYIAPCVTAPWWEEVLYRGFLLPALILQMKYKWAIFWSGIIFSIHHMSPTAAIPLAVLGWTWGILYAKSGNLLTTILVHAMWNSRVFLGSWLGL